MMRTLILVASLSCALSTAVAGDALAENPPPAAPDPVTTAGTRPRPAAGPQPGGIYARPGRCRELAIGRKLYGLARQRFIKRCRIARRAMPRPVLTGPNPPPAVGTPGPGTVPPTPGTAPAAKPQSPNPPKPGGRP